MGSSVDAWYRVRAGNDHAPQSLEVANTKLGAVVCCQAGTSARSVRVGNCQWQKRRMRMASTTPQPPVAQPPVAPPSQAPVKKSTSPLVWVLAGCGGLIVICAVVIMVGGYFVAHRAKGFLNVAQKNPAMAIAKLAVAANPDVEIVLEDDDRGIITIRNKKTGEELTMNAEDIKAGKLKFKNEKGEE